MAEEVPDGQLQCRTGLVRREHLAHLSVEHLIVGDRLVVHGVELALHALGIFTTSLGRLRKRLCDRCEGKVAVAGDCAL